jgi:hypothetical protein
VHDLGKSGFRCSVEAGEAAVVGCIRIRSLVEQPSYRLEIVELDGVHERRGPIVVTSID